MSLTAKQSRFVDEYLIDLNATQAAIRAGYSKKGATVRGSELLANRNVADEIALKQGERSERTKIDQDFVLKKWEKLVNADPNELTSIRICACRYCHGNDHLYQWRTEDEFHIAQEAYFELPDDARNKIRAPVLGGGWGYSKNLKPVETCPNCDGLGIRDVVIGDTRDLSDEAKTLFAGVKETQHGLEIKMHDQMSGLLNLAKHLGMFPNKVELTGRNGGPIETVTSEMTPEEAAAAYKGTLDADDEADQV